MAKGFSSHKEKEVTKDVFVEKVYDEVQTEERGSLSNCNDCGNVFPSAPALRSHTRYKHLKKTCKIPEKTFQSIYKLKTHKRPIPKGRTNQQEITFLDRCTRRPIGRKY